jgi:hypothetical protein
MNGSGRVGTHPPPHQYRQGDGGRDLPARERWSHGGDDSPRRRRSGELTAKEVTLSVVSPSAGIEAISRTARREGDGAWKTEIPLPGSGPWLVRVEVLVTDFDKITLEDRLVRQAR